MSVGPRGATVVIGGAAAAAMPMSSLSTSSAAPPPPPPPGGSSTSTATAGSPFGGRSPALFDSGAARIRFLQQQLDSKVTRDKMEAMKRVIEIMARGQDASMFFPDVVKNVITHHVELKKLVYNYLVNYAEQKQELALLAINSFQKDMADRNQLIRAMALRVMASIRVLDIVHLIVMAVRKCISDPSPYVRKAAAHAISKVHSLDPSRLPELIDILKTMLRDTSTLVLGSVLAAYNEVCPDNYELLHTHYRKLCHLVVDMSEWGQIATLRALLRYGRANFVNPVGENDENIPLKESAFYSDEESDAEDGGAKPKSAPSTQIEIPADQRLLLKSVLPLAQSRNSAVVMLVASIYVYLAPMYEAQRMGKPLVRIMHASREHAYIVLANIATLASRRPQMFAPYLKEFFVRSTDPMCVRSLKLDIITNLTADVTLPVVMKEFRTYLKSNDESLVRATIRAVGRVASRLPAASETCMRQLVHLLSNKNDANVGGAVIEIKGIIQAHPDDHDDVLEQLTKLLDTLRSPQARAAAVWLIGEYAHKIPLLAPDVLRKLAKTFKEEDLSVKGQVLTLAVKMQLRNKAQCDLLFQYVLNLARYDADYDLRDRTRLIRHLFNTDGKSDALLSQHAARVFGATKPLPAPTPLAENRSRFVIGTLSHTVVHAARGYEPLPDFPEKPTADSLREPPQDTTWQKPKTDAEFYDSSSSSGSESGSRSGSRSSSRSGSYSSRSGSYSSRSGSYSSRSRSRSRSPSGSEASRSRSGSYSSRSRSRSGSYLSRSRSGSENSRGSSRSGSASRSGSGSEGSRSRSPSPPPVRAGRGAPAAAGAAGGKQQAARTATGSSLLDMLGGDLAAVDLASSSARAPVQLLNYMRTGGLQVDVAVTRQKSSYGEDMHVVRLTFANKGTRTLSGIRLARCSAPSREFEPIGSLGVNGVEDRTMSINFGGRVSGVEVTIAFEGGEASGKITCPAGELVKPRVLSESEFAERREAMGGMSVEGGMCNTGSASARSVAERARAEINAAVVKTTDTTVQLSAETTDRKPVLVSLTLLGNSMTKIEVMTDSMWLGPQLVEALKKSLGTQL